MLGDMAIKDLTPESENIGGRLVKNMRICGSGIYKYSIKEAPLLGLAPVPDEYKGLDIINVYRPPEVLEKYKDYFARVPIITGHHIRIDRDNAKRYSVGMIGDTVRTEIDESDGELYLYTTGTIITGDGVEAYEDLGQLSVGYDPVIVWESGEHNGEKYHAVLKEFKDVNHVLICKTARGGPQCMVMDSLESPLEKLIMNGGNRMNFFSKIFGRKLVGDEAVTVTLIQSMAVGADPSVQVPKIKKIVGDSNKEFTEYLDDLVAGKDCDDAELRTKACKVVEDYYVEKMCGDKCGDEDKKPEDKKPAGDEDKKPEDKKPEDKKPEDKKPAGDEGKPCEKCGKSPCECGDKDKKPEDKPAGDEDKKPEEDKKQAGDELVEEVFKKVLAKLDEKEAVKKTQDLDLGMPMPGDSKPADKDDKLASSDDILALMRG